MAERVGDTYVNLGLKKGDFDAGLKRAKAGMKGFERDTLAAGQVIKAGFAALIGGGAVMGMKKLSDAYALQVKNEHMLAAAMKEKGLYTQAALQHNLDYATSLQRLTTFGDEEIMNAQRIFTNYRIEGEMLDRLTKATLDLAAAKEMDLKSAADLVAKSVGSSTNALARYGIEIEGAVGSTERMENAVESISRLYSGTAEAAAENYHGQLIQLNMAWGDLHETLGAFIGGPGGEYIVWLKDVVVRTDDYVKSLRGGQIEKVKEQIRETERTLEGISTVRAGGGPSGWLYDFLFGSEGEAAAQARLATLNAQLDDLEQRKKNPSILEARRAAKGKGGPVGAGGASGTAAAAPADDWRHQASANLMGLDTWYFADKEAAAAAERAREAIEKESKAATEAVVADHETMGEAMRDAVTGWGAHFAGTLNDAVWDADASFASIAESFGRMMTQMIIQKAVVEPMMGQVMDVVFGMHDGGVVGEDASFMRLVPPGVFRGAPRYHDGLMPDEFPAILQRGETVIPRGASAGLGDVTEVVNHISLTIVAADARSFTDMMRRNPGAVTGPLREALRGGDQGLIGDLRGVM